MAKMARERIISFREGTLTLNAAFRDLELCIISISLFLLLRSTLLLTGTSKFTFIYIGFVMILYVIVAKCQYII